MSLPAFTETGDLPLGVYPASLRETLERFAFGTPQRKIVAMRLERIFRLAFATGQVARFVVFGSFITEKPAPNDVDVFLLMKDSFDVNQLAGEGRFLFDHAAAQAHFGTSVFWLRRLAAHPNEQEAITDWQIKRDGTRRGIVEIIPEQP